jgi:hypothetical protein
MIFRYYAVWVGERKLCNRERNPVLLLVFCFLFLIPFEPGLSHNERLAWIWRCRHTFIWLWAMPIAPDQASSPFHSVIHQVQAFFLDGAPHPVEDEARAFFAHRERGQAERL